MFTCGHGNNTTISVLKQIQTYHATLRQMTVIPQSLQRRRIPPNSTEKIHECVYLKSKALRASPRSLYRKIRQTNKIFINHIETQVRLNYIKHQQTNSNIIPRPVSCNRQTSEITILYEHIKRQFSRIFLKSYLERNVTHKTQS